MVKCVSSKVYMELLDKMEGKNIRINVHKKLTKNEIEIIIENPKITQVDIANRLKVTPKTIQKRIPSLKTKQIIKREGSNKSGYWKILK